MEENNRSEETNPDKNSVGGSGHSLSDKMDEKVDGIGSALQDIDSSLEANREINKYNVSDAAPSSKHPGIAQGDVGENRSGFLTNVIESSNDAGGQGDQIPGNKGTGTDLGGQGTPGARDASQLDDESANDMAGGENKMDIGTAAAGAGLGGNAGRGTASGDRR